MHNYWLVVDTIRIPNAIEQVTSHFKVINAMPLYAGTQLDYLIELSPMVFELDSGESVLQRWGALESFDTSSVMFCVDGEQHTGLVKHLRSLLILNVDQTPTFLRFYTHSFWQAHCAQFTQQDIDTLLGNATRVYWYEGGELKSLSHQPSGVPKEYQLQLSATAGKEH